MNGRILVIGMGNDYRRDDGVGPVVARRVADRLGDGGRQNIEVLSGVPDPLDLLGRWDDATLVVVVDAVRSDSPAGTVSVVDLTEPMAPPPSMRAPGPRARASGPTRRDGTGTSTHGIGVISALRLAEAVGQAPGRVVLVTVAGDDFGRGDGLGPAVADAVTDAVACVVALVAPENNGSQSEPGTTR